MRTSRHRPVGILGMAAILVIGLGLPGAGRQEPGPTKSARGGLLARTERHQFEILFYTTGVRVFPQDAAGDPVDVSRTSGTATFYHPNSPEPWFSRPLRGAAATNQPATSFELAIGLGNVPTSGARVTFELSGLPDPSESTATFTVPFELVPLPAGATSSAVVQPPGVVPASPPYVYGPGYYGYGYYANPRPEVAPPIASSRPVYSAPSRSGGSHTVGPGHRDWTTGRDLGLHKPWLRPMD